MDHPLPIPDQKGMILVYFQLIHNRRPCHHLPPRHYSNIAIRPKNVHPQFELAYGYKPILDGEERMLLVGMEHLTRLGRRFASLPLRGRGDRQVH